MRTFRHPVGDVGRRLGRECRNARRTAGLRLLDVALAAGVSEATLSRFEHAQRWPDRFEEIVATYERECGLPERELWRRAIG